jgi:putative colanic acid biosynthesis UDP-glucose lipid carrier transferase
MLDLSASPMQGIDHALKRAEDVLLSLLILLLISPVMLLVAIGIKLGSRGPVFYRQERVTWSGRKFAMLKFRSMPVDVEQRTGAVWAKRGDGRATKLGAFLRRTSLDELPQFINVLKGDMSIVGPRPERPMFVEQFKERIPGYMQKHMVKAGITGWAQINGWRGDSDLNQRIKHDLYYIEHWSLLFDLRIIALTPVRVFTDRNAY